MTNVFLLLTALAALAAPLAAQSDSTAPRTTEQAAYTEDQASRGKTVFEAYCASCHAPSYHTGAEFRHNWHGRTIYDLFRILKTTMPEDNIGGLSDDDYTRVIAYILKLNGFPAGSDSLRADSLEMRRIRIGTRAGAASSGRNDRQR